MLVDEFPTNSEIIFDCLIIYLNETVNVYVTIIF